MDELSRIFCMSSSGSTLPWLWIIEYLSSFREIDTSIIHGLIKAAPVSPEALGKNIKERVALRCLEDLFGPNNGSSDAVPPDSRVVFDHSKSCNDVLKQILQEVSVSDLKNGGPELLKWDLRPYIMHKRASLPKCALEQLKDSRKENPVIDGCGDASTSRHDDIHAELGDGEGNLTPAIRESDNELLQDELIETNVQSKRSRNDMVVRNSEGLVSDNLDVVFSCDDLHLKAGNFKQNASCISQSVGLIPAPLHGNEQLQVFEANHVENDSLQKGHTNGHTTISQNVDEISPHSSPNSDQPQQNIASGEANDDEHPCEANDEKEQPCVGQLCEYEDEFYDVALKKSVFLNSHCRSSQDPLGKAGRTEQNCCVKCNRSDPVLVCSSSGCPLAVHESCLDSPACFDDKGNFRCPFCVYTTSVSEYQDGKERIFLARAELHAFLELLSKINPEEWMEQI